jgi:hypothetical protein
MTDIQIASLVFVGLALFSVFLKLAIQGQPSAAPDSNAILAVRQMVHLRGLSFPSAQRFWDPAEYEMLRATPELRDVTATFRKDRQTLALAWISLLLDDVYSLWRFRRFLVRNGVQAKIGEEFQILQTAIGAILFLNFLRIFLRIAGPFALAGAASRARRLVEGMSYASAGVLDRLPRAGWADVERDWQKSAA